MKKFLKHIGLFSLLSLVTLFLLDYMVTKGLRESHALVFDNMTQINEGAIDADIIILGSSKALVQVSTKIIDSALNVNSYNFGMNGANFEIQNLVYQLYRKNNPKPDYILQILGNETMDYNEELHEYKRFAPYLQDSLVRRVTQKRAGFKPIDFYFPFFKYAGFSIEIINGIANFFHIDLPTDKSYHYKGYKARNSNWDHSFAAFKESYPHGKSIDLDSTNITLFENFIDSAQEENIEVILVYPPTYFEAHSYINNRDSIINLYKEIADEKDLDFLNYSDDKLSQSKEFFYNSQHLNKKGARIFSRELCKDLIEKGIIE